MQINIKWFLVGVLLALFVGVATGYFRYWFGFFVLGQGIITGLIVPWLMGKLLPQSTIKNVVSKKPNTFVISLMILLCFLVAQILGFGLAQPWFDSLGWLGRVVSGDTSEHIFGVSMLGGVASRHFEMGLNGGFWIFLNLFDLLFMEFFLLVGLNTQLEKKT